MKAQPQILSRYYTYIKPYTKLPIVKTYGSAIFTLLIITFFIFYAIKPTVETILVLQKKLEDSSQVLEKITQKSKDLSQGKINYDNLDPNIKNKIETAIPSQVNLRSVIQSLEQTAQLNNASVSALQIQPLVLEVQNPKQGTLNQVNFTFNAEGTYPSLVSILQNLKRSDRLITIDRVSLTKASQGSQLIMSITGKAYYIQ